MGLFVLTEQRKAIIEPLKLSALKKGTLRESSPHLAVLGEVEQRLAALGIGHALAAHVQAVLTAGAGGARGRAEDGQDEAEDENTRRHVFGSLDELLSRKID